MPVAPKAQAQFEKASETLAPRKNTAEGCMYHRRPDAKENKIDTF